MNQTNLERLFKVEGPAGGHKLESFGPPDHARESLRPAGSRQDAEVDLGQADLPTFLLGNANVAGQGDFQAAANRMAIERRDYQLGGLLEPAKRFVCVKTEVVFEVRVGLRKHGNARTRGEKVLARASNNDDMDVLVHARPQNCIVELKHHFMGITVDRRIVHFEDGHAVLHTVLDELLRADCLRAEHDFSPLACSRNSLYFVPVLSPGPRQPGIPSNSAARLAST